MMDKSSILYTKFRAGRILLVFLLPVLLMTGCTSRSSRMNLVTLQGRVFGTYYTISYFSPQPVNYQQQIEDLLEEFNQSLSYYQPNSLISRINRNETEQVDDFFRVVFERGQQISEATGGAFDATVGPLVNAWGFGFQKKQQMTPERVDSLKQMIGYTRVRLQGNRIVKDDPRIQFDFNAIAKGYGSDVVGQFLETKGISAYMVEIGGDLIARGLKPDGSKWRIGLEVPAATAEDAQQWDYYVEMHDLAVATSGNYRKYYEENGVRLSHTIDPSTGYPVSHSLLSVSVFAPDAMSADAFATAFMVMGLEESVRFVEQNDQLEAYFIFSENGGAFGTYTTPGLTLHSRER